MNKWLLYERKRNAFEKKWKPRIQRVLNNQLQQYVSAYRRGESTAEAFGSEALTKLLFELYADVGSYWGRSTYKDLRTETRGRRTPARVGSMAGGKALATQGVQVKRFGALGFSIDWANRIISRLRMAGLNLAQFISETTRKRVLDILEDAQTENLTLDQTVQRITTEVQEINRNRAEMIARTEVGRASSEGKMQGAKALGMELEKIWISARDNRTRFNPKKDPRKGDHWVLNGQRKPLDEPFDNGVHKLMQPGDPSAPPAETIRCRCTVVFEVKKDITGKPVAASTVPVVRPASVRTINIEETVRQGFRPAATVEEAKQWAKDNLGIVNDSRTTSLKAINEINERVYELQQEYKTRLKTFGDEKKAYASANSFQMNFNKFYFDDSVKFERILNKDIDKGWHPKGTASARATIDHEFAHVLTNLDIELQDTFFFDAKVIRAEYNAALKRLQKAGVDVTKEEMFVSNYAQQNLHEFVAESFSMALNSAKPSPYAIRIKELIDKYYKK